MFFTFIRNYKNNNQSANSGDIDTFLELLKEIFFCNKLEKFSLDNGHDILTLNAEDDFYVLESTGKDKKWLFHKTGSLLPIAVSEIDKKHSVNTKLSLNITVLEDIYEKPEVGSEIAKIREKLRAYANKRYLEDSGWGKLFGGYSKQEKIRALDKFYQGNDLTLQDIKILKQGRIGKVLRTSMQILDNKSKKKTVDALLEKIGYEFDSKENLFIIPPDKLGRSYVEQMGKITSLTNKEKKEAFNLLKKGEQLEFRQVNILKKLRERERKYKKIQKNFAIDSFDEIFEQPKKGNSFTSKQVNFLKKLSEYLNELKYSDFDSFDKNFKQLKEGDSLTSKQVDGLGILSEYIKELKYFDFDNLLTETKLSSDNFVSFMFDDQCYTYDSKERIFKTKDDANESVLNASHMTARLDNSYSQVDKILENILLPDEQMPIDSDSTPPKAKGWRESVYSFFEFFSKNISESNKNVQETSNNDFNVLEEHNIDVSSAILIDGKGNVLPSQQFEEWRQMEQQQREQQQREQQQQKEGGILSQFKTLMFFGSKKRSTINDQHARYTKVQNGK